MTTDYQKKISEYKVGICGVGMVGGAMQRYFEKKGIKPFLYDPGKNLGSLAELNRADVIFICVPTPFVSGKGFDLSYVKDSVAKIEGEKIIVIKSTVVPGTTEKLQKDYPQHQFLFNPEFLTELTADQDMNYPDRQIIGYTKESFNVAKDIILLLPLAPFEKIMPSTEAELVKYYGNNWFSVKVIYANQFYDICQKVGADYNTVMESAAADKRIGPSHLVVMHKGYRGFGGKCLAGDEIVFQVEDSGAVNPVKIKDFSGKRILSSDTDKVFIDEVLARAERPVKETLKIRLSKGRTIEASTDHLMAVINENGSLVTKEASKIKEGDKMIVPFGIIPGSLNSYQIDFYGELSFKEDVFVENFDQSLAGELKPFLTFNQYKGIKREREMAVPAQALVGSGIGLGNWRIKTSKTGSWVPNKIELNENFARLMGYYLAEGCCSENRVFLSFGYHEKELIEDTQQILNNLQIHYSSQVGLWKGKKSNFTFKISSRILSHYFKQFGSTCYEKTIPGFMFLAEKKLKDNLLAGLFRGDGSIVKSNMGDYYTISYASVSKKLVEGVDLLLREKGILSSRKVFRAKKSLKDCYQLLISENEAVKELLPLLVESKRNGVCLKERKIKSPSYERCCNVAFLRVEKIEKVKKFQFVYSLETKSHYYLTSGGILTHNCLPKDIRAMIEFAEKNGLNPELLKATEKINNDLMKEQGIADPEKFSKRE